MRLTLLATSLLALSPLMSQTTATPPLAPRKAHQELRHGEAVQDDYFWLREKQNPEVVKYLEAENAYTASETQGLQPFADALYKEMLGRIKQTDLSVPQRRGDWWYYSRTVEGQQYPIQCRKHGTVKGIDKDAKEQVILDQNELAKGKKFLGLGGMRISDDGDRLLYSTDETGFRQYSLFVKDLTTGAVEGPLAERVTSVAWAADGRTAFFTTEDPVTKRSDSLWRLDLATHKSERLYQEKDELFRIFVSRSKDKRYLLLDIGATDSTEVRFLDASKPTGTFQVFLPRKKDHKYDLDHREGLFYIRTNMGAKNYKLMTAPDGDLAPRHWKEFIPHDPRTLLEGVDLFKDFAVAIEKREGLARFRVFDFQKGQWKDLAFPEEVYSAYDGGNPEYDQRLFRFNYQSPVTPDSVFDYDLATGERKLLKQQEVLGGFDPSRYECRRLWATARDGVKVPLSVVHRKGVQPDGRNPLLLYGYGSYGFGMPANFNSNNLSLLDRGVVYVIAHIRGGNEMGEAWHDDGMLMKKKNTFNDFIDSAEWLIANKWTAKDRLVIEGGSAGGLLMGAVTNMRPDLFKAVHAAVPFVDVMNTMLDATLPLTVGEYLEWGNPNDKAAYDYMRSYSPYDNLAKKAYPAILVTTSFNDSQVMYWEPAKYVARLRTLKTDGNPLLLKCKMDPAGHGGASGRYDVLRDRAWELAWMLGQLGIGK
ncbi:MAG TPA: S9 family peptidase [Holophagaceae bacterium]|nr:S9 family peptidase [Holophagaceae bacterium]